MGRTVRMMNSGRRGWLLNLALAGTLLLAGIPAAAQEAAAGEDGWAYNLSLYGWGTGFSGEVGPQGHPLDVHSSISDVLDVLDFAAMVHFDAHKGKWGIVVDPLYANLGETVDSQGRRHDRTIDLDMEAGILGVAASYQLHRSPKSNLDLTFGARTMSLTADIAPRHAPAYHARYSWVDPVVGLRGSVRMSRVWTFAYRADLGGFGVGSDLTWNAAMNFDARVSKVVSINLGYIALYNDYKSGSGPEDFTYDATFLGPFLGLSFRW